VLGEGLNDMTMMEPDKCASPEFGVDVSVGGGAPPAGDVQQRLIDVCPSPGSAARRRSIGRIDVSQFRPDGFDSLTDSQALILANLTPTSLLGS